MFYFVGFLIYFCYGIRNSMEGKDEKLNMQISGKPSAVPDFIIENEYAQEPKSTNNESRVTTKF